MTKHSLFFLKVIIIFFLINSLWIEVSNKLILYFLTETQIHLFIDATKNWGFATLIIIVNYFLISFFLKKETYHKKKLRKLNLLLNESQKIAKLGSWELNSLTNELFWSDQVYIIFGLKPQEFNATYEKFLSYVHPEYRQKVDAAYFNSIQEKKDYFVEHRILLPNGIIKYVEEKCIHKYDKKNEIIKSIGTILDITDKKILEREKQSQINLNEKIYENLFIFNKSNILLIDPKNGNIINANYSAINFYGYDRPTLLSLNIKNINHDISKKEIRNNTAHPNNKYSRKKSYVASHTLKNNERRNVKVFSNLSTYMGKDVIIATVVDVTAEIRAKTKLAYIEHEYKNIFEFANVGLLIRDINGLTLNVNDKLVKLLGYKDKADFIGKPCQDFSLKKNEEDFKLFLNKLKDNKTGSFFDELKLQKKDASFIDAFVTTSSFKVDKDLMYIITSVVDITLMKNKDRVLTKQAKMAAMGEMIENIAHQWKQPLSNANALHLNMSMDFNNKTLSEKKFNKYLLDMEDINMYLSSTVNDFSNFLNKNKKTQRLNFQELLEKTISMSKVILLKNDIKFILKIKNNLIINSYPSELMQVLFILINNSNEAFLEKDTLNKTIIVSLNSKNNEIHLTFSDNGGGIENCNINNIFNLYFSTKEEHIGFGLGLFIAKSIIEKTFNGKLLAENINSGVLFTLKLPISVNSTIEN